MKITWLGHGTAQFETNAGEVLVMDPWIEGNPSYPKEHVFQRVDAIAVTHGHFDHIHDVLPLAKKFSPKVVGIFETTTWLESKGATNTVGMNKGGTLDLGFVKLTMTHAIHSCGILDDGKIIYGGEDGGFSSLRAKDANAPILNLEQGHTVTRWGRMIFYVADVDTFWEYLRGLGFHPEIPRDASWGERYFHMSDPEGHELSFARPI